MRFSADFQSMGEGDTLAITFGDLLDRHAAAILIGGRIQLDDLEGNHADAVVDGVDEHGVIDVTVDMATWWSETTHWTSGWDGSSVEQHWNVAELVPTR